MKKMTGRRVSVLVAAVLSVIFFFIATLFVQLCSIDSRIRGKYYNENLKTDIVSGLFDYAIEDLSQKAFKAYFNGNKKLYISVPPEYREDSSNFFFAAKDSDGKVFLQNYYTDDYYYHETKSVVVEYFSAGSNHYMTDTVTVECYLRSDFSAKDSFSRAFMMIGIYEHISVVYIFASLFTLLSLCCLIKCLKDFYSLGKLKKRGDKLSLIAADMLFASVMPLMLLCVEKIKYFYEEKLIVIKEYLLFGVGENQFFQSSLYHSILFILLLIVLTTVFYGIAFGGVGYLFSYARYKKYPFTHGSIIYFVAVQIIKSVAIGFYFASYSNFILLMLLFEKLITLPVLFKCFKEIQEITEKTASYAEGDLSSPINTKGFFKTFSDHASDIESITDRISLSADEYIQSSKFKAELITNLSHDIKTPLTSILNYAQLLKKEDLSKEEKGRFLSVLGRHSVRLQKLVEDLVEVSDASSGNISAKSVETDLCEILPQIVSGFEERLQKRRIRVKMILPQNAVVMADTRLFWRVIDNLMNNICKYAKEDTEATVAVTENDGSVSVTVSNISAYEIEGSGKELTERFMRADSSRHTEGSGLGLSIAKSLMELMNGTVRIEADKEHFSAQVIFFGR